MNQIKGQTHQFSELQIVEELKVSALRMLLFFVQLPPEAIGRPHVQHFNCVDLPRVTARPENMNKMASFLYGWFQG